MKKNIIIAAIAAASALLLSVSCQKDEMRESGNGANGTFTGTIEQGPTKTTLTSENKVNWESGDKISINGKSYTATPDGSDATKATFTADDGEATPDGGKYKAVYPSTLYATDHLELPATYTYTEGKFNMPMYAESATTSLAFKNICAVLAIKVTSADITTLRSIKVKSDKAMCGTFTVSDNKAALDNATDATKAVELVSSSALTLDATGTTFYIAIPEQTYSFLKIYLSEDGTLYKRAMITKKAAGLGTIECNKIYSIDYETNAVQLYAGGPYWSTMNVGATTETGFGRYFGWGDKTGYALTTSAQDALASSSYVVSPIYNAFEESHSFNTQPTIGETGDEQNPAVLPPSNDAAYQNWGAAWKMPTGDNASGQFQALFDNTQTSEWVTEDGVNGRKFTGKSGTPDYSDIELFFPAAGSGEDANLYNAGSQGRYWSSSLLTSSIGVAIYLYFTSGDVYPSNRTRRDGYSVRPVSD